MIRNKKKINFFYFEETKKKLFVDIQIFKRNIFFTFLRIVKNCKRIYVFNFVKCSIFILIPLGLK